MHRFYRDPLSLFRKMVIFGEHRRIEFRIGIMVALVWAGLSQVPFFDQLDWLIYDALTTQNAPSHPLNPTLKLVTIDEESIQGMANPAFSGKRWAWPWPRSAYADIIVYLKYCGVKEIWFDMFFNSPSSDALQDDELRAAASAADNVHFAYSSGVSMFQPTFDANVFARSYGVGSVLLYNRQGRLLVWPPAFHTLNIPARSPGGENRLILSAIEIVTRGIRLMSTLPSDDRTDPLRVKTLWTNPPVLPPIPPDQFDPAVEPDHLKGKIVYVGITATAGADIHALPVGPDEPGVIYQLTNRSNAMDNLYVEELILPLRFLFILCASFLAGGLYLRWSSFIWDLVWTLLLAAVSVVITEIAFDCYLWIHPIAYEGALLSSFAAGASYNYVKESQKRQKTADLFGKFVSKKMVQRLINQQQDVTLGGERAELTIMFSDLSGFTTLSETMSSDQLVALLNQYLDEMSQLIVQTEGTLDKYIGDAILAFWGAPDPSADHAWKACYAALDCQKRLGELAPEWERQYGAKLYARLGINTDVVTVGLIGSRHLHNYSVIGDAVNLASRLEGANKKFGTTIMIAQRTVDLAVGKIEVRPIALLVVKGKTLPVPVYELMAKAGGLNEKQRQIQALSTRGFQCHLKQEWDEAMALYKQVLQLNPGDPLADFYIEYIQKLRGSALTPDWNGVLMLDEK